VLLLRHFSWTADVLLRARPAQLLTLFDARNVHHVWVVGDDGVPIGVVTPTDVLQVRCCAR
jgi:CBS domain containing-hemolysin-like protein